MTFATKPVPLLEILLEGLRATQLEQNCYCCLTSDDPKDICATHLERLRVILNYAGDKQ